MRCVFHVLVLAVCVLAPVALAQDDVQGPEMVDDAYPEVVEVVFEGLESYDGGGVLRTLGVAVGRSWPEQMLLRQGIDRVFKTYGVVVEQPTFTRVPGGVSVLLRVRELPVDLEPRFVGNQRMPDEKLREWALLFDREQIYVHEADRVRSRILQGYKRQGFHFAEVDVVVGGEQEGTAAADVIFQVREGPKVRVTRIRVVGNESLPDTGWGIWRGGLRKMAQVKTKGVGVLRWWGGVFDEEVLAADLVAMTQVYRDRGWVDARVTVEPLEFSDDRSEVRVTVLVDEGPLYRVRSVGFEAVEQEYNSGERRWDERPAELLYPEEELQPLLNLEPGLPLEMARIQRDRAELGRYYGEQGYIPQDYFEDPLADGWTWLEPIFAWDTETREVDVTYRFSQGRQRAIREVAFVGNVHTRDRVLRREISAVEGERANIRDIERGLARLRGTGYFQDQYDLSHPPPRVHLEVNPDNPDEVDVVYTVEEGRVVDMNVSGGVTSDSGILGLVTVSMKNFEAANTPSGFWSGFGEVYRKEALHGNGETLVIDLAPGSQISYYKFFYRHADLFGSHFNRWTGSIEFEDRLRRYRSHDEERQHVAFNLGHLFGQGDFSLAIGPRWQEVEFDDLDPVGTIPGVLERSAQASEFVGLDLSLRYSQLDNRMSPRSGQYVSWDNTIYGGPFGGDHDIWKSSVEFDYYKKVGGEEGAVPDGIYFGGEVGVAHPYGDTEEVHYAERKFYGGASSVRGFDYRGIGPNEGNFSVGGESFLRMSAEYRTPVYTTPIPGTSQRQEMLRAFVFADAAILGPDSFDLDLDEHRAAVGFGFALTNPIPLKFNFGFPIRTGEGDEEEVFSFRLDWR